MGFWGSRGIIKKINVTKEDTKIQIFVLSKLQSELKTKLETLDKTYLSTKTNLSAGLSRAIDIFSEMATG